MSSPDGGPRWPWVEWCLFAVVALLLQGTFRERGFYDPGSLWHPVVGELILDHGFMTTDPFTYTFSGQTWIPQQWGMEVIMALIQRAGGRDALLLAFSMGTAAMFTGLFARFRGAGVHAALAAGLTGLVLFTAAFHFFVRPHMVTIALLGWTMACLVDFDRGRTTWLRLAGLVPLYILWTNLHGGVLGGVLSFGICYVGWVVAFAIGRVSPLKSKVDVVRVGLIGIACGLTPLVNPFGLEMLRTWQRIVGSPVLKAVVNEHKALDPTQLADQLVIGFGLFYGFCFLGLGRQLVQGFRVTWLVPLIWFGLGTQGIRQGPLFAVTAGVVLCDFWRLTLWHDGLRRYGDSLAYGVPFAWTAQRLSRLTLGLALIAFGMFLVQRSGVTWPVLGQGWARLDPAFHPTDLTRAIQNELATYGPNARILNDANLGGYMIAELRGQKIFMDDRFELYGDAWTRAYVDCLEHDPQAIESYADRFSCTHALFVVLSDAERARGTAATPMETYLAQSPRWELVARSERAAFYRRLPLANSPSPP